MINIENGDLNIAGTADEVLKEVGRIVAIMRNLLISGGMDKKSATKVINKAITIAYEAFEKEEAEEEKEKKDE